MSGVSWGRDGCPWSANFALTCHVGALPLGMLFSWRAPTERYERTINLCFTMPTTFIFTKFVPNKLNNYLR